MLLSPYIVVVAVLEKDDFNSALAILSFLAAPSVKLALDVFLKRSSGEVKTQASRRFTVQLDSFGIVLGSSRSFVGVSVLVDVFLELDSFSEDGSVVIALSIGTVRRTFRLNQICQRSVLK